MGTSNQSLPSSGHINFAKVKAAALQALPSLVQQWLPDGRREQNEWVARNPTRVDNSAGSFKINLQTGVWSDFATSESGGDPIDLWAYLKHKTPLDSARDLADMLNVKSEGGPTSKNGKARPFAKKTGSIAATPGCARMAPVAFPPRTAPGKDGKPRFIGADENGPRIGKDERRRHVYRAGGVPVHIKIMRNGDANPFNVYRVIKEGVQGWQYGKPEGFQAVPYFVAANNPFEPQKTEQPVFWPEGEKDVESLSQLGARAFTFGGTGDGLPKGCEQYVTGRVVVILADNDEGGRRHAEQKAALAATVAARVQIIHFPELGNKQDVSDWFEAGHTIEELNARVAATDPLRLPSSDAEQNTGNGAAQKPSLPYGYGLSKHGLMWSDPDDLDQPAIHVAGHFDVVAETRDADGESWGVLIHWKDHDQRDHRFALPRATLAGDGAEARRILMDGGLFVAPSQKARSLFNSFLLRVHSLNRARATQRVGWHGNSFVLPDDCFGADERESLILQTVTAHAHSFRQLGNLESWQQNVARYASGNSRLILALSAAFAGPLIGPCSAEGGGIHFKGASSTGKSTALHVAGSAWGGGGTNGYIKSWRATANGLEGVCLAHSDTVLCLDEISQVPAKEAGEAAYMIANGQGKHRSSRDGLPRAAATWRVLFLSSGEIGLADKIAEDGRGRKLAAGQQVRIVDVPADAGAGMGMFENLHGFPSAEVFARHLRSAAQQHYGVAARQYLSSIVPTIDDLRKEVGPIMKAFCEQFVPAGADGQVERVAQRFALIAVGGEFAQQRGILPWEPGEAIHAAGKCLDDWLKARGGIGPAETHDGIAQVRSFLLANGMARFIPAWEQDQDKRIQPRDVAGFRRQVDAGWDFFVTTSAWREEVCRGFDSKLLAATLAQRGSLYAAGPTRRAKLVTVPGHGKLRLYHILAKFLEDSDA